MYAITWRVLECHETAGHFEAMVYPGDIDQDIVSANPIALLRHSTCASFVEITMT
jgi:hypothetical protein